jgi:hypothetical protein
MERGVTGIKLPSTIEVSALAAAGLAVVYLLLRKRTAAHHAYAFW